MIKFENKNALRRVRHARVRTKVFGTGERPRLNVYRSNNHIYAQVIDDVTGMTLVSASTMEADVKVRLGEANKSVAAKEVGSIIARRALEKEIKKVVFDRGGYLYTGRVAALATGAREAGLEF